MSILLLRSAILLVLAGAPVLAAAQVVFTEIMYDMPGADSGREWVEIQNTSAVPLDISGWKFFENDVNHRITPLESSVIPPGGYAVVAANTGKFLADYSSFSGVLLKSSFSFSNSGESFSLKDTSGREVVVMTYAGGAADGDGNSLNMLGDMWGARKPTPGGSASSEKVAPEPKAPGRNPSVSKEVSVSDSAELSERGLGAVSTMAAVGALGGDALSGMFPWLVALVAVIGIAAVAIFLGKPKRTKSGYTIIEEE